MRRDHDANGQDLPNLVNRTKEYRSLSEGLVHRHEPALYLYGPKGTGKTLLTRHALSDLPEQTMVCTISCIQYDTQYKVLTALCNAIADGEFTTGYHTAQLYTALTHALADQDVVLVLDDIDFLLLNDGSDLLYTLSRLDQHALRLVLLSANHPDLSTVLDERTFSSLRPYIVRCEPYTEAKTVRILTQRTVDWLDQAVTDDAVAHIAATTTNIHLGHHWLTVASEVVDGRITEDIIRLVHSDVMPRYQNRQLAAFSVHHRLLVDAIEVLTADTEPVRSGAVYDWYKQLCTQHGTMPLSTRRISDYLKHLELLRLIRAEYQYGGDDGKTRYIWLQQLGE